MQNSGLLKEYKMAEEGKQKNQVGVRQIILGSVFLNENILKWLPIVVLLAFLGLFMISTRFRGEKILRETHLVQEQVRALRSESATTEARLMRLSRYSTILKETQKRGLGLKQSNEPPRKIKID